MPEKKDTTARRGRPTKEKEAERKRRRHAQAILAWVKFQDLVTAARCELGVPQGGFGEDEAALLAWWERAEASERAEVARDAADWQRLQWALAWRGMIWPQRWTIQSLHHTLEFRLHTCVHAIKIQALLDDTWHEWVQTVILRGADHAAARVPTPETRVPPSLFIGANGQTVVTSPVPPRDSQDRPTTSRLVIYVDDDMTEEDVKHAFQFARESRQWQVVSGLTQRENVFFARALAAHLATGQTWRSWQDTPDGQLFRKKMGLQEADREMVHHAVMTHLKPILPTRGAGEDEEDGS